jgi:hypothetical protein
MFSEERESRGIANDLFKAISKYAPTGGAKLGGIIGNGLLEISYTVYDSLPIAKTYVGVKGALSLAEDYIHLVREMNKTKASCIL